MIKVIAFDFGGVLGSEANDFTNTFREISELSGLTPQELSEILDQYWPKLKIGKEKMKNFWKEVARQSKSKVNPEELRKSYNQSHTINRKVLNLAIKLKKKYKIIVINNASDDEGKAKIEKFKIDKIFDKVYCSAFLGMAKPGKEIFEYVLKDLKIKPQELLFIDNQEKNIKTSKALGINSILFTNYAETVAHVKKFCN